MSKKTTPEKKNRKLLVQMAIVLISLFVLATLAVSNMVITSSFSTCLSTSPEANDAASAGEKDVKEAFFSEERLESVLRALPSDCSTDGILKAVTDAVHDFVGDAPQFDDMTMLALIYDGKEIRGGSEAPGGEKTSDGKKASDGKEVVL